MWLLHHSVPAQCRQHAQAQGGHHQQLGRIAKPRIARQHQCHQPIQPAKRGPHQPVLRIRPAGHANFVDDPTQPIPSQAGCQSKQGHPGEPSPPRRGPQVRRFFACPSRAPPAQGPPCQDQRHDAKVKRRSPYAPLRGDGLEPAAVDGQLPAAHIGPDQLGQSPRTHAEMIDVLRVGIGLPPGQQPVGPRAGVARRKGAEFHGGQDLHRGQQPGQCHRADQGHHQAQAPGRVALQRRLVVRGRARGPAGPGQEDQIEHRQQHRVVGDLRIAAQDHHAERHGQQERGRERAVPGPTGRFSRRALRPSCR